MNVLLKLKEKIKSEVSEEYRYNFKYDCIQNALYGFNTGMYVPFIVIVAKTILNCSHNSLIVLNSLSNIAGFIFIIISALVPINKEFDWAAKFQIFGALFFIIMLFFIKEHHLYVISVLLLSMCFSTSRLYIIGMKRIYGAKDRPKLIAYSSTCCSTVSFILSFFTASVIYKNFFSIPVWKICFFIAMLGAIMHAFLFLKFKIPIVNEKKADFFHYFIDVLEIFKTDKKNNYFLIVVFLVNVFEIVLLSLNQICISEEIVFSTVEISVFLMLMKVLKIVVRPIFGKYVSCKGPVRAYGVALIWGMVCTFLLTFVHTKMVYKIIILFLGTYSVMEDVGYYNMIYYVSKNKITEYITLYSLFTATTFFFSSMYLNRIQNFINRFNLKYNVSYIFCLLILIFAFIIFKKAYGNSDKMEE